METNSKIYRFAARFLATLIVAMGAFALPLYLAGCGDESTTRIQNCVNNGPGQQQCIDGNGNITDSPCVTVNGALVTSTGQSCDLSSETTVVAPTPEPSAG